MSGSPTESNSKEIQLKLLPLGPRSGPLPVAYPSVVPSTWCNFSALRGLEEVILQPAGHIPPRANVFDSLRSPAATFSRLRYRGGHLVRLNAFIATGIHSRSYVEIGRTALYGRICVVKSCDER